MKLNSLADLKKKNKRTKIIVLLSLFLLGALFRLETIYHTLRVKDIRQSPDGIMSEQRLVECFSPIEMNCSPLVLVTRYKICKNLENIYPSKVWLSATGWGRWCFVFGAIKPLFRVSYRGQEYYLNAQNKLWSVSLKENNNLDDEIAFQVPRLIIDSDIEYIMPDSGEDEFLNKKVIFDVTIDIAKLKSWYNKANELNWLKYISACQVQRIRQKFMVKFYLTSPAASDKKSVLILSEDISTWNAVSLAIGKLWGGIDKIPQGLSIDALLEEKIMVKPIL